MRALEEEFARVTSDAGETEKERALVIGIVPEDEHFEEMLELVRSAGVAVAGTVRQKRSQVHPRTVVGQRQAPGDRARSHARPRHGRDLRHRPEARPGARLRGRHGPEGDRPHAAHPRRLRPARAQPRRQAPGRARPAQVLAAAPDREGRRPLAPRRRHRRPGPGRDGGRDRPPAHPRPHPGAGEAGREPVAPARPAPPAPAGGGRARPLDHRLHQRRQEHAAERHDRQRGRGRGQALHDPRPYQPPPALSRARARW